MSSKTLDFSSCAIMSGFSKSSHILATSQKASKVLLRQPSSYPTKSQASYEYCYICTYVHTSKIDD